MFSMATPFIGKINRNKKEKAPSFVWNPLKKENFFEFFFVFIRNKYVQTKTDRFFEDGANEERGSRQSEPERSKGRRLRL